MGANDPRGVANLDPRGHGWQDLCRRPQHRFILNLLALGLIVSEKKIVYVFPIISLWELMTPGRVQVGTKGLIGRIYVGDH